MSETKKNKFKKRYFYTYKITLLKGSLAGKYYYGQHITYNLNDGYCGSGTIIKSYYKKYRAIENITYVKEILKFYNDEKELDIAEKILIGDLWKTDDNCLNLKCGGQINPFYNKKHTIESINKMKKSHIGQIPVNLDELKQLGYEKSPTVDQYDKNGKFIKQWPHLIDASKELKIDSSSIIKVIKGKRVRAGGFVWRYKDEPFAKYRTTDKHTTPKNYVSKSKKPVAQFSKDGELINKYDSLKTASKNTNIDDSSIGAVCNNKRKTAGGYVWKFI